MTILTPLSPMQRSRGEAFASFTMAQGRVRLGDLKQAGSAKAILPHVGAVPEVVFLNTSGGLTGGDRLSYGVTLGDGVRVVATTQTAERAYFSNQGAARVDVNLSVAASGWIDWLPQETILFDGSNLDRRTRIDLGAGSGCLALEAVVLGRAAMGETVTRLAFRDRREIWADRRPVHLEPLALDAAALQAGAVTLGTARAFASVVMVCPAAGDALAPLRAVLTTEGVTAAASAYDGRLTLRMMAADGWPLRRQIACALHVLRRGAALPRVWQIGRD